MDIEFGYRDKNEFELHYIYEGMNAYEMSKLYAVNDSVMYSWRKKHNLPNHKDREAIISIYGKDVYDNIVARKSKRYSVSNKLSHAHLVGKTLEEIYGEDRADQIKRIMSIMNTGKVLSEEQKEHLRKIRKGNSNPNWRGGFYSKEFKVINRNVVQKAPYSYNAIACAERDYICEDCGTRDYSNHGHHVLSFSTIFGEICNEAMKKNKLNTDYVAKHVFKFHKLYYPIIYACLCVKCHRKRHSQTKEINEGIAKLMYVLEDYIKNEMRK